MEDGRIQWIDGTVCAWGDAENMLLSFKFKNWKSFAEENEISFYSTYERQHGSRRAFIKKYNQNILPIKAIFGGNASGKSNMVSAIEFVRKMITESINIMDRIDLETFEFDQELKNQPSEFFLQILVNEYIYHYKFTLTKEEILSEELSIENSQSKHLIYKREKDKYKFGKKYEKNDYLKFASKGTKKNKLFLRNTIEQGLEEFENIYQWFQKLSIISPDTRIVFPKISHTELKDISNVYLSCVDTGIEHLELQEVNVNTLSLPKEIKDNIWDNLSEENFFSQLTDLNRNMTYFFEWVNGDIKAYKHMAVHNTRSGEQAFDLETESAGTRRVIELIPVFQDLVIEKDRVVVIDELDKSFHTQLTRALVELFLDEYSENNRGQLIFTTHDIMLMDQSILRRDEMDLVERNQYGESRIFSISDFDEVCCDTDLRKKYLEGRFGGIPKVCEIFL